MAAHLADSCHFRPKCRWLTDMFEDIRRQNRIKKTVGKCKPAVQVHLMIDKNVAMQALLPVHTDDRVNFIAIDPVQGCLATAQIDQSSNSVSFNRFLIATDRKIANQAG